MDNAMLVLRPAAPDDVDRLVELVKGAGVGMTNLPPDRDTLSERIARSKVTMAGETDGSGDDVYLLVLENRADGDIVGTSGIYARIGLEKPFYSYKIHVLTQVSRGLDLTVTSRLLQLVNDFTGCSEVGMLYLHPRYRQGGNGRMLAMSRYLLMAEFRQRFTELVIAELRGWLDDDGNSPFWDHLGRHFFELPFPHADYISATSNNQFIADLMPKYPIYVDLLPGVAREVIGKPHDDTRPALALLEREGFRFEGYIDIFDGGPTVQARVGDIRTVQNSRPANIAAITETDAEGAQGALVSNARLPDFRVCRSRLTVADDGGVTLAGAAAEALGLGVGDRVRYVPLETG